MTGPPEPADVRGIARDPAVLEVFYRAHFDAVLRFVVRRVDDAQTAADLTADVFMAAVKSAYTYRGGPGGARAWLYGVARNVIAGERHRTIREGAAHRRAGTQRLTDPDDIARVEEQLDAERRVRELYRVIGELPEGDRAVLELVSVDGLGVGEAARALGIGPVAARTRLHRARRRLARRIDEAAQAAQAVPRTPRLSTLDPSRSVEVRP